MPPTVMPETIAAAAAYENSNRIDSSKMEIAALTDATDFEQWHRTLRSVINSALIGRVDKEDRKQYLAALAKGSTLTDIPESCEIVDEKLHSLLMKSP